jgi:hypothetical protein
MTKFLFQMGMIRRVQWILYLTRLQERPPQCSNDAGSSQNPNVLVWQDNFTTALTPFLDSERIQQIKDIYLQGRNPPRVSDSGWAGRKANSLDADSGLAKSVEQTATPSEVGTSHKLGGRNKKAVLDDRKVVSEVLVSDSFYLLTLILL